MSDTMASRPTLLRSAPVGAVSFAQKVAGQVRYECALRDWTAIDLSIVLGGVSLARARHLYKGRRSFTIEELDRFVRAVDVDVSELLERARR